MEGSNVLQLHRPDETFPWPGTGEALSFTDAGYRILELQEKNAALHIEIERLAVDKRRLEKRIEVEEDPNSHAQGKEIIALVERWKTGTGHVKSLTSGDRIKLVKARLKDGYTVEQLELAVDGIAAFPFVVNGQRKQTGNTSQRHDRLGICLGGGEKVEEFARYGHAAHKQGWTVEGGWS